VAEFLMPSLGADMEAGTLVEWLVKAGDRVKRGDIVAVIETQKGAIESETCQAGQIEKFLVDVNSKVPVGTPLALIRTEGEERAAVTAPVPPPVPVPTAPPTIAVPSPPPPPIGAPMPPPLVPAVAGRLPASPAARRLAADRGIDLSTITGSGPSGAIV